MVSPAPHSNGAKFRLQAGLFVALIIAALVSSHTGLADTFVTALAMAIGLAAKDLFSPDD